ncbi:DUF1996 domain-containing protein [Paractinoplanes durhamensis]|uniref:DUF1996 domain-containing protein n=1 Tax=Paractinoplanes durhamensis TaxID=113563 RepID=UPI001941A303|nr:DUF1996 domain-containing protein [Actinoplanes durhamensis]
MSITALPEPESRRSKRGLAAALGGAAVVAVVVGAVAVHLNGSSSSDGPDLASKAAPIVATASSAAPPATRTTPPASTKPATKPAEPGWIPVDPKAWQAQVAAFKARKTDPVPAGVGDKPEFRADCTYSHRLADDPIVFPGLPGASHMHSFVGNKAVDAATTAADLIKFTASTCKPIVDHSSYWVPTLYDAATRKPVETTGFRVYYRSIRNNSTGTMPIPTGLRMIAGDAKKKVPTPRGAQGQFYCAFYGPGDLDGIARSTNGNWPICGEPATLHFMLQFPDCWDGKNLDSPNHKDHIAYGSDSGCPKDHPVRMPALTFDIQYGVKGTAQGYYLSSDPAGKSASSMHGDAFLMWDADAMNKRTKDCVLQRRTCGNDGYL